MVVGVYERVWNKDSRVSREVLFVRRSVMDGMRWAGTKMVCRMSWGEQDFENGTIGHCPYCWDEVLKQVTNTRCPHCHGTGYEDGYAEPFPLWCSILENSPVDEKHEKAGYRDEQNVKLVLPCEPIFKDGDIFAEVRKENGRPLEIGRIFMLDGPVERQTVQGWVSDDHCDNRRRSRVEDIIVSQRGTAKVLLPTDSLYSETIDFWGGCDCGCATDEPVTDTVQGDQPTVDVNDPKGRKLDLYDWWS